jgi:hypothetical protein
MPRRNSELPPYTGFANHVDRSRRRIRIQLKTSAVLMVLAALIVTTAFAQIDRGTIKGSVTDPTGAIVPGAKIQVVQVSTNSTTESVTDSQGLYNLPNLPAATYRVTASQQGFKTAVREPVEVRPTVQVQVDFKLDVGAVSETVEVTSEAPILDVSTTNNATGLNTEQLHELPYVLAGTKRSITAFLQNLPGSNGGGTFNARANGAQAGNTEVFLDGARASEQISRGALEENGPMVEQVGDFNVVQNAFNAEYGGFGSWFTTATIKSGTNIVHGSVFDHFSNSIFNAKGYFPVKKTPLNQHEGGFTLGGPVVIPHIYNGRNKTFVFGSLGLFFSRVGAVGNLVTVPLTAFTQGDFRALSNAANTTPVIYDPATTQPNGTRTPFSCNGVLNVICPNRISPAAKQIIAFLPPPDPGFENSITNNFHARNAASWPYFNTYVPLVKIDQNISNAQKLSVMYTRQIRHRELWNGGLAPNSIWGAPQTDPLDYQTDQVANSWKLRINHDYVITNNVLNHFTYSADRYVNREANKTNGQGWDQKLGITGIPSDNGAFPAIAFSGGTGVSGNYGRAYTQNWYELNTGYNESLTWNRGQHNMKFGGEFGTTGINNLQTGNSPGSFTFSNFTTSSGSSLSGGNSFASFLLGQAFQVQARIPVETGIRFRRYAAFAQDEWRATPKLTVSYGLRWDYQPPYFEVNNKFSSLDPTLPNPGAGGRPGALAFAGGSYGKSFQAAWKKGFGPRVGLAYQLNDKTLVRGSTGIYYAQVANQPINGAAGTTITPFGYTALPTFASADNFSPIMDWTTQPFPQNFSHPPSKDPSFLNGQAITLMPRIGDRLPQIFSWTASIQRQLARNLSAEVSYLGNHSTHLAMPNNTSLINVVPIEKLSLGSVLLSSITSPAAVSAGFTQPFTGFANQLGANTVAQSLKPFPQYTAVNMDQALLPEGESKYNSLQIKATKRTANGWSGLVFLTWSKQITNSAVTGQVQYPLFHTFTIDPAVVPLVFSSSMTYELPFGAGRHFADVKSPLASRLISGWRVNGFVRYTSGAPLLITTNNNLGPLGYPGKLASFVPGVARKLVTNPRNFNPGTAATASRYLNASAFAAPAAFELGNTGTYLANLRGFTQKQESISFGKSTKLTEHSSFELTADFTNPFNFVRWSDPATNISSPSTFGAVTNAQAARAVQINGSISF